MPILLLKSHLGPRLGLALAFVLKVPVGKEILEGTGGGRYTLQGGTTAIRPEIQAAHINQEVEKRDGDVAELG